MVPILGQEWHLIPPVTVGEQIKIRADVRTTTLSQGSAAQLLTIGSDILHQGEAGYVQAPWEEKECNGGVPDEACSPLKNGLRCVE